MQKSIKDRTSAGDQNIEQVEADDRNQPRRWCPLPSGRSDELSGAGHRCRRSLQTGEPHRA